MRGLASVLPRPTPRVSLHLKRNYRGTHRRHGAQEAARLSRHHSPAHPHRRHDARLARAVLQHRLCNPRQSRPGHGDARAWGRSRLPRPLRAGPSAPCRCSQCALAGRPHPARLPHPGRSAASRSVPGSRPWSTTIRARSPVHGFPGRTFHPQHLPRAPSGDLAQGRSGLAGLRRCPMCSMSTTAPTSPAAISTRSRPACAFASSTRPSRARRAGARSSACSARSTPSCCPNCPGI